MLTGKLRNPVDKIWEAFWTGGITNPISVIEQFSCLLFIVAQNKPLIWPQSI
jgi:type I restriction enzyme M protein